MKLIKISTMAILSMLVIVLLGSQFPLSGQVQAQGDPLVEVIQLNASSGRSVGVFSEMPNGWSTEYSTEVLAFGNYVGNTSGTDIYIRSYLWFPIPALPAGYAFRDATLELYTRNDWPFTGNAVFGLYRVTENWDETMPWAERATAETTALSSVARDSTQPLGWVSWDASLLVQEWISGTENLGVMVAAMPQPDAAPSSSGNWALSTQGRTNPNTELAPRLTIRYTQLATPTPLPTDTPTPQPTATPAPPQPTSLPQPTATPSPTPTPEPVIPLLPETGRATPLWSVSLGVLVLVGGLLMITQKRRH